MGFGYIRPVATTEKPLISANMVTSVRLLAMPLLAWLVYQGDAGWWWALALGFVVGSTDFVDGLLARKYGPTVLGGMLDPLADKVFIALGYLPLMHLGFFPPWAVGLLFVREFLVTAMRSAYQWRGLELRTSYLGKMKTWVQMQGVMILMIAALISHELLMTLLVVFTIVPLVPVAVFLALRKGLLVNGVTGAGFMLLTVVIFGAVEDVLNAVHICVAIICLVTWVSGLDYLIGGLPKLSSAGGFHRADLVRVVGSIATPVTATLALVYTKAVPAPVFGVVALELAVGGLDNLLSRHKAKTSAWRWASRTLGTGALLLCAVAWPAHASLFAWLAFAATLLGVGYEFWRSRAHYLDDRKWDEALVA